MPPSRLSSHTRWLLLFSLLLCAAAHAQTACPWLTQGTAEALLNGPVIASTNLLPGDQGTCAFTLHQDVATSTLEITVATANLSACPAGKPLTGIGNQATLCTTSSRNQSTDTVSSRVRDHYFTVQLTTTGKATNVLTPDQRQALLQQAAEEVAGNLY